MSISQAAAPMRASAFLATFGVNTHIPYTDGGYVNIANVEADLKYLGITQVRDTISNGANGSAPLSSYIALAEQGIKFTFFLEPGTTAALNTELSLIDQVNEAVPGSVTAVEGANEINNFSLTYNGVSGLQGAINLQEAIYADVHSDPKLAGVSVDYFTGEGSGSIAIGPNLVTTAGLADYDTEHPYPNGNAPAAYVNPANSVGNESSGIGPVVYTETGYSTNGGTGGAVNADVQARYSLDLLMDAAKDGVSKTYLYQLMDAYQPGSPQGDDGFGLFNPSNQPKEAATAIHDLTTFLSDTGANAATFTTTALNYVITGLPTTGNSMVLEKSNGAYDVVVWNEPKIWNQSTGTEITAPTVNVVVQLGDTYSEVEVFDPLVGSTPIQVLNNVNSVQLGLTDHPLIIEIEPAPILVNQTASQTWQQGQAVHFVLPSSTFTDPQHQTLSYVATLSSGAALPSWLTFNTATDTFTGTVPTGASALSIKVTATDTSGFTGSETFAALNATAVPAAPTLGSFSPDSNVVGDGITNVNHLSLNGTAAAGFTVEVFDGITEIGTTTANGSGVWSFATATLTDGTHAFTSKAMDAAGNVSAASAALSVKVDTVAPNAPDLISDTPTSAFAVLVAGTAEAGSSVNLYEGTTLLGTGLANSSGNWDINTGSLSAGAHAFTATAIDAAGNVSALSAVMDPVIGPTMIETSGSTSLAEVGNNFYFYNSAGSGPSFKFGGAAFVAGEFGAWTLIGAEQTSSGYDVALKVTGADQYTIWSTDSNGNFVSALTGTVSGTSVVLESYEPVFHQDLNGDGLVGPPTTVVESSGSTSLVEVGNNFYFYNSAGSGPSFKFGGLAFVAGEFGAWTLIGAEQTSSGYDVALKVAGADQYTIWSTDSNGNFVSALTGTVSGTSVVLESYEPVFHQDLNGDGLIGPPTTVIESSGSTSLTEIGNAFYFYNSAGSGPSFKFGGSTFVAGEFGAWTLIGAEQTSSGYDVALKVAGADQYTIWSTDSSGDFLSALTGTVSGTSVALESYEPAFHQDLNGDGLVGPTTTMIESSGSTSLAEVGNNFYFYNGNGSGPSFKFGGSVFVAGEFGAWTLIGAEQTSSGYDVALKVAGADQYTVWSTDSNGNFVSALTGTVSGNSMALESYEPLFHQDLNGDGVITISATAVEVTGSKPVTPTQPITAATIDASASLELTGASSASITFGGATGTLVLDHSSSFTGKLINLTGDGNPSSSDQIDLRDVSFGSGTTYSYAGNSSGGILTISDAQNHTANIALTGNYTNSTFTLSSDGHGGTLAIDPPKENFDFASNPALAKTSTPPSIAVSAGNDGFVFHQPTGGNFGGQSNYVHNGFGLGAENSQLFALASDAQSDHQWMPTVHVAEFDHGSMSTHFADHQASHFIIH